MSGVDGADALHDACPGAGLAHDEDGVERAFAVDHLVRFQLTRALEDLVDIDREPAGVEAITRLAGVDG